MHRTLKILLTAFVLAGSVATAQTAQACPMCQVANEDDTKDVVDARPRAYMYSILFMLSMPATLLTVFGVTFYRLSQQQTAINEEVIAATHRDELN